MRNISGQHSLLQLLRALGIKVLTAVMPVALWVCLASTACRATEWQSGVDAHPRRVGQNAWHFKIHLGVKPVGQLQFVGSQFDFAWQTRGIAVDYDFTFRRGGGWSDSRSFQTIAPTLFDTVDGFINGWEATDLNDGTFSGVVYATAPPTAVYVLIAADSFVPVRRR